MASKKVKEIEISIRAIFGSTFQETFFLDSLRLALAATVTYTANRHKETYIAYLITLDDKILYDDTLSTKNKKKVK